MFHQLLVSLAFCVGQIDTPSPPPCAEGVPEPPTATERWLLMTSLQSVFPTWLDGERFQITGWSEGAFTASSVAHNQLPMGFNYLANQFALQQNWLRVERALVTTGTTEPSFGFRADTILPGTDYRFTLSRGLFSGQLTANDGQPTTYGIDPVQFYGEAYFPNFGYGLDVKFGRIFCQYGAETIDAPSNALVSHSYMFLYDPFTHTGVMATQQLTAEWSIQMGAVLGPDVFIDPAASPYGMASIKWSPPGGRDSVLLSVLIGSGRFDADRQFDNPNVFDMVCTHSFNSAVSYTLDALFGYENDVPNIGTATWFGLANYLKCQLTEQLSGNTRLEFFDDIDGNRTGFKGLYTAVTAGLNFKFRPAITFRPELRYDYSSESRPFQNNHGLFTGTADVIVRW